MAILLRGFVFDGEWDDYWTDMVMRKNLMSCTIDPAHRTSLNIGKIEKYS